MHLGKARVLARPDNEPARKLVLAQAQRQVSAAYAAIAELRQARLGARDAVEQLELLETGGRPLTPQFSFQKLQYLSELSQALSQEAQAIADEGEAQLQGGELKADALRARGAHLRGTRRAA